MAFDENYCTWLKRWLDSTTTPPTKGDGGGLGRGNGYYYSAEPVAMATTQWLMGWKGRLRFQGAGGEREREKVSEVSDPKMWLGRRMRNSRKPNERSCKTQTERVREIKTKNWEEELREHLPSSTAMQMGKKWMPRGQRCS